MTHPVVPQPDPRRRTLLIAAAVTAAAVVVGLVIALGGSSSDTSSPSDDRPVYGPVTIDGASLSRFTSTDGDGAVGQAAPVVDGRSPTGAAVTVGGAGKPTMLVFLAHWCPHCQRELPLLVEMMRAGDLTDLRAVAVLTGTSPDRPNFPPTAWLDRERWTGDVLLDDDTSAAAQAFGLSGYPFLVFLDADGSVVARASGELPRADIIALAELSR